MYDQGSKLGGNHEGNDQKDQSLKRKSPFELVFSGSGRRYESLHHGLFLLGFGLGGNDGGDPGFFGVSLLGKGFSLSTLFGGSVPSQSIGGGAGISVPFIFLSLSHSLLMARGAAVRFLASGCPVNCPLGFTSCVGGVGSPV